MKLKFILAALCLIAVTGCAGTLHYGTYAKQQAAVYESQAKARGEIAKAWAQLAKSGTPQTQGMAAMGLFALGMAKNPGQLAVPKDELRDLTNIIVPWLGAYGIADSIGRHMTGHGGQRTTTTNNYDAEASGTQSTVNIVPGDANTINAYPATTTTTTTKTTGTK